MVRNHEIRREIYEIFPIFLKKTSNSYLQVLLHKVQFGFKTVQIMTLLLLGQRLFSATY